MSTTTISPQSTSCIDYATIQNCVSLTCDWTQVFWPFQLFSHGFPVTKNEPDYRLFLVHVLHKLDKLDDRPVRDNEKATAKIHCDQNKKWSHYREIQQPTETATSSSYKNPRASYVKNDYVKAVRDLIYSSQTNLGWCTQLKLLNLTYIIKTQSQISLAT